MTSVTVAGAFPVPETRVAKTMDRDRWLRYGVGAAIAGLLAVDATVLVRWVDDNAARRGRTDRRSATAAAVSTAAHGPSGDGFSALQIPSDLTAFAAAAPLAQSATADPTVAAAMPAPAASPSAPAAPVGPAPDVAPPAAESSPVPDLSTVVDQVPVVDALPTPAPVESALDSAVDAVDGAVDAVASAVGLG